MKYKAIKTKLYLSKNDQTFIRWLLHTSKNLYNEALYNVRQHFFKTGTYLTYEDNYMLLSRESEHYKILNSAQGQGIIRKVDEAMKAFFGSIKSKKSGKVKLPRYLEKDGFYSIIDRMVYKPNKEYYILPRGNFIKRISKFYQQASEQLKKESIYELNEMTSLGLRIETPKCIQQKQIKEITIKSKYDGKYMEVIYVYQREEELENNNTLTETMAIDFGYNNLAYCAVTNNNHLHIDGLKLKSMNQRYHKRISLLASVRPNQLILTKRMISLIEKRNNQMIYGINKAAKLIIEHAINNDVGAIIIGYNEGFKDIKISKKVNQWFKAIPIARLRDRIVYLAKEVGIESNIINEAYTSVASYVDNDDLVATKEKTSFSGNRIQRGLYKTKHGILINADLNAALNILRKGKPDALRIGSNGWNTPKRTYLFSS